MDWVWDRWVGGILLGQAGGFYETHVGDFKFISRIR